MIETKQDINDDSKFWTQQIELSSKREEKWRERAKKVIERYRDEEDRSDFRFNILWANTDILKGALFQKSPEPDVRRRFKDKDPLGKAIAVILERALSYCLDSYDFTSQAEAALEDLLLPGRGQLRCYYEPVILPIGPPEEIPVLPEVDEFGVERFFHKGKEVTPQLGQNGPFIPGDPTDVLVEQNVYSEYVLWEDYRQSPERIWTNKQWVAFRHIMDRRELVDEFGDIGNEVPLNFTPEGQKKKMFKQGVVWEIWDKRDRQRVWIAEGFDKVLDKEEDPYGLKDFFPCPEPMVAVRTNDKDVPIPEYTIYQDQAEELDVISTRINKLIDALRRRGVYDAQFKEVLQDLVNAKDNEFKPVQGMSQLVEKGGLERIILELPITKIAEVLASLYIQRDQVKSVIYELTGIADIFRGASNPKEKATTQSLKAQFGTLRLNRRTGLVDRFLRDTLRIKAELIAEHYEPELLSQITGQQVVPEMIEVLRKDKLRAYHIDIETDSTVQPDANAEKERRIEFITALSNFLQQLFPLTQTGLMPPEAVKEMLMFALRPFKVGREMEEVLDSIGQQKQEKPTEEQLRTEKEKAESESKERMQEREIQSNETIEAAKILSNETLQ